MKNKFDNEMLNKIKNVLIKKSEGYFYNEEVLEYQNKADFSNEKEKQISFLNNDNEKETNRDDSYFTLTKKKVTTHYVPPDLLAVKMLVEIFGEKVNNDDLSNLSDNELIQLKNDILKKLEEL